MHRKQRGSGGNFEMCPSLPNSMPRQDATVFVVDEDRCFGCAACVGLCPVNALVLEGLLVIVDEPSCTHCEHCIPACPVHALSLENEEKATPPTPLGVLA
jgi:electron transport complex protein RnfB